MKIIKEIYNRKIQKKYRYKLEKSTELLKDNEIKDNKIQENTKRK